jgi:YVTN family beta-propeller protein
MGQQYELRRSCCCQSASGEVEKVIPTGKNPQGGVMTKDSNWVYLTNNASNTISVIDASKRVVAGYIETGDGPARIALTPDEQTLAYNLQAGEGVGFADVRMRAETSRIKLPGRPLSLSLSKDGRIAYLGVQDTDRIASFPCRRERSRVLLTRQSERGPTRWSHYDQAPTARGLLVRRRA